MEERAPRKEVCFFPMKRIQAIEGLSQDHACKIFFPQIGKDQAHPVIYTIGIMNQEVSCKHTQTNGIEKPGTQYLSHWDS